MVGLNKLMFILSVASSLLCHMQIVYPPHRQSKFSPYYQSIDHIDWDALNPLGNNGTYNYPYPCKGHPKGPVQASYTAGTNIHVNFTGIATHSGGHCQFAISYDDNKFVVVKDVLSNCLINGLEFDIPLPANIPPSKNATLVWGWLNALGNREWYMNCIDIEIKGGNPAGKLTGPQMLVGNLPGLPLFPEFHFGNQHLERFQQRPIISAP